MKPLQATHFNNVMPTLPGTVEIISLNLRKERTPCPMAIWSCVDNIFFHIILSIIKCQFFIVLSVYCLRLNEMRICVYINPSAVKLPLCLIYFLCPKEIWVLLLYCKFLI